jgi:hypothetical protein
MLNPASSNPFVIYHELYMPWKDDDAHSKIVHQYRIAARTAIHAHRDSLEGDIARRLESVAECVSVRLFLPVVYRVDLERIDESRRAVAGSGLSGSREVLVKDLLEEEFDVLFLDDVAGTHLAALMDAIAPSDALVILEEQCR